MLYKYIFVYMYIRGGVCMYIIVVIESVRGSVLKLGVDTKKYIPEEEETEPALASTTMVRWCALAFFIPPPLSFSRSFLFLSLSLATKTPLAG